MTKYKGVNNSDANDYIELDSKILEKAIEELLERLGWHIVVVEEIDI